MSGLLKYQAQSPDENALVSAARNFGFVFTVCYYLSHNKSLDRVQDMVTSKNILYDYMVRYELIYDSIIFEMML